MAAPIVNYVLTGHASFEMERRGISTQVVHQVLGRPEQRFQLRPGRDVLQSRIVLGDKTYLIRVFVDVNRQPAEVVTAYRTSKIEKYWREDS